MQIRTTGTPTSKLFRKIGIEYLTAPFHIIAAAAFSRFFLNFRTKVLFDQVRRREHAFGLLRAADIAKEYGYDKVSVIEFGVASGGGVMNMYDISRFVEKETGVSFKIYGFDTGTGLPEPIDYRDHPEMFAAGDYPLVDPKILAQKTDGAVELIIGDVNQTAHGFMNDLDPKAPLGFFTVDVDYYSSATGCLTILNGEAEQYLPYFWIYFDDINFDSANRWCGELLAINEFNASAELRKIEKSDVLKTQRVFKNSDWVEKMRSVHIFDHPARKAKSAVGREVKQTSNAALGISRK